MLQTLEMPAFYPLQNDCAIEILKPLKPLEIPQIINSIINSNRKELPENIINRLAILPSSENPLYLSMAVQRLMMLDSEDFKSIATGGDDMNAINNFMLDLINSFPYTPQAMARYVLKEAGERIDSEFCDTVGALLATSRRGLRETDLQEIFKNEGIRFSTVDLFLFVKYMQNFFMQREDGRLDFTHRVIREGLLENIDFEKNNLIIFNHLKTLDKKDAIKISEIVFHGCKADKKDYLSQLIIYSTGKKLKSNIVYAWEISNIIIENYDWATNFFKLSMRAKYGAQIFFFLNTLYFDVLDNTAANIGVLQMLFSSLASHALKIVSGDVESVDGCGRTHYFGLSSTLFQNMASMNKTMGEYDKAIKNMKKVIAIGDAIAKQDDVLDVVNISSLMAGAYNYLSEIYIATGEIDAAKECFSMSIEVCEKSLHDYPLSDSFAHDNYYELVGTYSSMGSMLKAESEFDEALTYYLNAYCIIKPLADALQNRKYISRIALLFRDIGATYKALSKNVEAKEYFEKSFKYENELLQKEKSLEQCSSFASACARMGGIFSEFGDDEKSLFYYEKAHEIREILVERLQTPMAKSAFAVSCSSLGNIYGSKREFVKSLEYYERAFELYSELYELLKNASSISCLADVYKNIGYTFEKLNKLDKAIDNYLEGIILKEQFVKMQPSDDAENGLIVFYNDIGNAYRKNGDTQKAEECLLKAYHAAEQLCATNDLPRYLKNLALACVYLAGIYLAEKKEILFTYLEKNLEISQKLAVIIEGSRELPEYERAYSI